MDTFDCVATKLEVKEYDNSKNVPADVKLKVLQAARLTASGVNSQHWRFVMIQDRNALEQLAADSNTGKWVANCDFAVIVLTDPKLAYHAIDAGRVLQDMQLAAWNYGVVSRVFTGVKLEALRKDFGIPIELYPTVIAGFGYPAKKITGKRKNRKSLEELVFLERFGNKFEKDSLR